MYNEACHASRALHAYTAELRGYCVPPSSFVGILGSCVFIVFLHRSGTLSESVAQQRSRRSTREGTYYLLCSRQHPTPNDAKTLACLAIHACVPPLF